MTLSHNSVPACVPTCEPEDDCPCQSHLEECHSACHVCVRKTFKACSGALSCPAEGEECLKDPVTKTSACMPHCQKTLDHGQVITDYGNETTVGTHTDWHKLPHCQTLYWSNQFKSICLASHFVRLLIFSSGSESQPCYLFSQANHRNTSANLVLKYSLTIANIHCHDGLHCTQLWRQSVRCLRLD